MAKPSLRVRRHLPAMPFTNVLQMESSYFSTTSFLTPQWVEISAQWENPTLNAIFNFVSARISLQIDLKFLVREETNEEIT